MDSGVKPPILPIYRVVWRSGTSAEFSSSSLSFFLPFSMMPGASPCGATHLPRDLSHSPQSWDLTAPVIYDAGVIKKEAEKFPSPLPASRTARCSGCVPAVPYPPDRNSSLTCRLLIRRSQVSHSFSLLLQQSIRLLTPMRLNQHPVDNL